PSTYSTTLSLHDALPIYFLSSLENPPHIIFVSGSEEYAYKAFNYNGIDYLLKPITYPRFCRAVEKIMKYYAPRAVPSAAGEEEIDRKSTRLNSSHVKISY